MTTKTINGITFTLIAFQTAVRGARQQAGYLNALYSVVDREKDTCHAIHYKEWQGSEIVRETFLCDDVNLLEEFRGQDPSSFLSTEHTNTVENPQDHPAYDDCTCELYFYGD